LHLKIKKININQQKMTNIQQYEAVFIISPTLGDADIQATVEKFEKVLKENNAEIVVSHHWGLRKLAYPIQKKNTGYYHLIEFRVDTAVIAKLEVELKRDERIMRFLTVKMDKFAIEYADRKRNRKNEVVETTEEAANETAVQAEVVAETTTNNPEEATT
jgi:small subunit ribosomal protein S6